MGLHIVPSRKNLLAQGTLEILGPVAASVVPPVTDSFTTHPTVVQSWVIRHLIIHALVTSIHLFFKICWHSQMFRNGWNKETNVLMYSVKPSSFVTTDHGSTKLYLIFVKMWDFLRVEWKHTVMYMFLPLRNNSTLNDNCQQSDLESILN
jgi:hypothetical protein